MGKLTPNQEKEVLGNLLSDPDDYISFRLLQIHYQT